METEVDSEEEQRRERMWIVNIKFIIITRVIKVLK